MSLKKNLSLYYKSDTAARNNIYNTPTEDQLIKLLLLKVNIIDKVNEKFDVKCNINSGYRSLELNRLFASSDKSQHIKCEAVDFESDEIDNRNMFNWIRENLKYDQCILEYHNQSDSNSGWIHCSFKEEGNRNVSFEINPAGIRSPFEYKNRS